MPGEAPFRSDFESDRASGEPAFTVDLDGFEGPLDLLLELARRQKVDLARISVLALAEQYLLFVEAARKQRLELAADYLVMAAWLAFLKSRLLLPAPPQAAEPDAVGARRGARPAAAQPRGDPQGGRAAFQPHAPRAGRLRPRRAGSGRDRATLALGRRTSTICSRPTPGRRRSTPARGSASRRAKSGRSPRRARRWRASSA